MTNLTSDKTTDENLTSENWELILNLCDKVQDEGQEGYVGSPRIALPHGLTWYAPPVHTTLSQPF